MRLRLGVIGLLLMALPCLGMAAFTPMQASCPMHTDHSDQSKHGPMKCCGEPAMPTGCKQANHCAHCNIAPSILANEIAIAAQPRLACVLTVLHNLIDGHDPTGLWRPPRLS
jgi:hypothetical protein